MNLLLALWLAVTSFAAEKTVSGAYNEAKERTGADTFTEVVFAKNEFTLSQDARSALSDLLYRAQKRGKIEDIKIIAWADKEYPINDKGLHKNERKLADDRIYELRNIIEEKVKDVAIQSFNMAEKPDAIEKLLGTSPNVKVKAALEAAGLAHPGKTGMPPKASRALIMVSLRQN